MAREVIVKVLSKEEILQREEEAELLNEFDIQYKQYSFRKAVVSPYENMGELIRCKDCKHRPTINGEYKNGFDLKFPTHRCPCRCNDDEYYSWMPEDNWYCPNGEL